MEHVSLTGRIFRGAALTLILLFFMFPIVWILLMSFQSNEQILRIPPRLVFEPTLSNYRALISGQLQTTAGNLEIPFMHNLWNSFVLSSAAVMLALVLGVPAAYAFARFKFRLGETIAFTLLSFRFAPPLLVLLPLSLYYQQLGLNDTYAGIVWVYQLIALPLILWIVRGYFEDICPDIEHAYRLAGHSWWETFTRIAVRLAGPGIALFAVGGIALVPGFMNAFLAVSLLLDRRPQQSVPDAFPGISILVAAYNEAASIGDTIESIAKSGYPGEFEVIVIDDGSSDATADIASAARHSWLRVLRQAKNQGKSAALNRGLAEARHALVVTLDADSYLYRDALQRLVQRYMSDPTGTRAVAGAMLVRNSRRNWITRAQEWDYFHGIAAVKRVQSLYQGTLVAQGAFSVYDRKTLLDVGGWEECVGEDIVLTWALLQAGWRIGHAEDACCFTNAPHTLRQFIRQRQRWARGMMEAFRRHRRILLVPRMSTLFIWWNLLFPWLDTAYTVFFIPGVALALFGVYWIAGPMTLALLPMALLMNFLMFRIGGRMFAGQGLQVRRNVSGFLIYAFAYSLILQPACVWGYVSELLGLRKTWGTK